MFLITLSYNRLLPNSAGIFAKDVLYDHSFIVFLDMYIYIKVSAAPGVEFKYNYGFF